MYAVLCIRTGRTGTICKSPTIFAKRQRFTKIDGKFQDEEFARWASDHNIKWSDSNFFVSDNIGILSNCCRLLSDTKKLDAFINSIGGTALSVGSCRVSTINLVRIAYEMCIRDSVKISRPVNMSRIFPGLYFASVPPQPGKLCNYMRAPELRLVIAM